MRWTEENIERELRALLRGRERWPRRKEFEAVGQARLLNAAYRHGGAALWAQKLGVSYPPSRSRELEPDYWTRPDLSEARTRLARVRMEHQLSQAVLARRASISLSMLRRLERGETDEPSLRVLANLALVLGVPVAEITEPHWLDGKALYGPNAPPGRADLS